MLSLVVMAAFILVYPTAQSYLAQRARLNAAERDLVAEQVRKAELDNQLERWSDPAYVTSQARSRLSFVMPGEWAYRVVDPETAEETHTPAPTISGSDQAWYADVWTSVQAVDELGLADE